MIHTPLAFIDVETSGGSARNGRIIDIGVIRVERETVVAQMNQLIYPERPVPRFISELTGIRNDMVWNAPTFERVAPELESMLRGAIFVAHNVEFDYSFVRQEFRRIGVDYRSDRVCSVRLSRRLQPQYRRHGLDHIIRRGGFSIEHRHRGYDDAKILWQYIESQLQHNRTRLYDELARCMVRSRRSCCLEAHPDQLPLL